MAALAETPGCDAIVAGMTPDVSALRNKPPSAKVPISTPEGPVLPTEIVPLFTKLPVQRMTVPLGTIKVTPLLMTTSVYIAVASEKVSGLENIFAPNDPSPYTRRSPAVPAGPCSSATSPFLQLVARVTVERLVTTLPFVTLLVARTHWTSACA
jgi:hypothetical protein